MNLGKPLGVIVLILIVYQFVMAWIWHHFGFEGYHFGWLTVIVNLVCFPLLFLTMVYKWKPKEANGWWTLGAYLVCWLPLIVSTVIGHVVYTHMSGYYHAMKMAINPGGLESIAAAQFVILLQCAWLTTFISLFMAWKSWWVRTQA